MLREVGPTGKQFERFLSYFKKDHVYYNSLKQGNKLFGHILRRSSLTKRINRGSIIEEGPKTDCVRKIMQYMKRENTTYTH